MLQPECISKRVNPIAGGGGRERCRYVLPEQRIEDDRSCRDYFGAQTIILDTHIHSLEQLYSRTQQALLVQIDIVDQVCDAE